MIFELLKNKYTNFTFRVVLLDISDKDVIYRLANRLVCENKKCQAIFNRTRVDLVCPTCGSALATRADDKEAVVCDRLAVYAKHADVLTNFYKVTGVTMDIISVLGFTTDDVFNEFKKILPQDAQ